MSAEIYPTPSFPSSSDFTPRYDLNSDALGVLEEQMFEYASTRISTQGVHALLIDPTHPFSNFVRTHEEKAFPGASDELSLDAELQTKQFALIDTRKRSRHFGKVAFVSTVSGFHDLEHTDDKSGIVAVDELIDIPSNNLSLSDFDAYCVSNGVDPRRILGVETTVKLVDGMSKFHGLRTAQLGYLTVFSIARSLPHSTKDKSLGFGAIGRVNRATVDSTKRTSIKSIPLMDRSDWSTPEDQDTEDFYPVMYKNRDNRVLSVIRFLAPKIIEVKG